MKNVCHAQKQNPETPPSCFDFFDYSRPSAQLQLPILTHVKLHRVKESSTLEGRRRRSVTRQTGLRLHSFPMRAARISSKWKRSIREKLSANRNGLTNQIVKAGFIR